MADVSSLPRSSHEERTGPFAATHDQLGPATAYAISVRFVRRHRAIRRISPDRRRRDSFSILSRERSNSGSTSNSGTRSKRRHKLLRTTFGNGFVQFFSHERVEVGFPLQWHRDPFSGYSFPTDRHWSQIADFGAGDIKLVWETNRFGFTFPLVRSYWRTGDEQYAEVFWQLAENWHASNSPESGANWKCGQEVSLRVMAWCFGLYGFAASPASTPNRVALLAQMIAVSGRRIESNIGYALSQKNNHGLSEAMGLWTIGALFPEFADSARWAALGRRLLESQALELIYDDGAFSQHSMNYHRVMLHDYLWSMRLADVQDRPFSNSLRDRIRRAGEFLYQLQDESTGRVPCYGQNDGALILPLTNCDYSDFRPVVQSAHILASGQRRFEPGPWDEESLWLFPRIRQPSHRREGEIACGRGRGSCRARERCKNASEFDGFRTGTDRIHVRSQVLRRHSDVAARREPRPPKQRGDSPCQVPGAATFDATSMRRTADIRRFAVPPDLQWSALRRSGTDPPRPTCCTSISGGAARILPSIPERTATTPSRLGTIDWLTRPFTTR